MKSNNAAVRQDVIENSVDHQISALANSTASPRQLEALLNSELDRDLIAWPRQYLATYLDSDATGRVPLDAEQLQDVLEAAFDRDATLARDYLEELKAERGPKTLGDSTLQIATAHTEGKEAEYELLFDPTDSHDLKNLIDKLDMRAWEKQNAQTTPILETQPDSERRETTTSVATHQPGGGAVELHDETRGANVRKLLGGGELPVGLRSALRQLAPDARIENAQTDSGTYRGGIIGETEKNLIQQITSHTAVLHRKDLLDMIAAFGENVRIAYSNGNARVLPVKRRSKTQELGTLRQPPAYRKPRDPGYVGGFYWTPTIVGFIGLFLTNVLATQFVAWRFEYQPALGPALVRIGSFYLYAPYKWLVWVWTQGGTGDIRITLPLLIGAGIIVGGAFASGALFFLLNLARTKALSKNTEDLHGSARWATKADIAETNLIQAKQGVYVGGWHEQPINHLHYLRHNGPEHILAFAPTRSGKGVGIVIPTLLAWAESTVVYDIKGENWAKTAGFRSQSGQICFKFSPVEPEHSSRFNPLAEIRLFTDRDVSDAQNIANMLVRTGEDSPQERYWQDAAASITAGMILHVCYAAALEGRQASLSLLAGVFTRPGFTFRETLTELLTYTHDKDNAHNWRLPTGEPTRTHPVVKEKVQEMLDKEDKDFSGVLSTAKTALTLYSDPLVSRTTSASDFTIQDLVNHERPVSLYLVVPPSDKIRLRPLMRLIFTMIVNRLTEKLDYQGSEQLRNKHRLLFLIDEFPSLKRMEIFADALSYMAGFGLKAYLITQDIRQIVDEYGRNESIVSNCQVRVAFAPNQYDTAELLSKMTGTQTIRKASFNFSGSRMSPVLDHMSTHMDEIERPLMTPDEIMRLRPPKKESAGHQEKIIVPGDMLIFVSGHYPIYGTQMLYFFDPILLSRAEIPPPTKFFSIHNGGLSPQDPLPDLASRPKPTSGPHPNRRLPASSGSGPGTATPIEQPPPPPSATLQPPEGLLERLDPNSER